MTSAVTRAEQQQQRQLDLMLALGEAVQVTDPETGEPHYVATDALLTMVEGRCAADSPQRHPRHVKEAPQGWRIRAAMMIIGAGLLMAAALPTAASVGGAPGVHRVIDDDDTGGSATEGSGQRITKTQDATTTRRAVPPSPRGGAGAPKRGRVANLFASGQGKHRARHISNTYSKAWWPHDWFTSASRASSQVRRAEKRRQMFDSDHADVALRAPELTRG